MALSCTVGRPSSIRNATIGAFGALRAPATMDAMRKSLKAPFLLPVTSLVLSVPAATDYRSLVPVPNVEQLWNRFA